MNRSADERAADVRRLVDAARAVYEGRALLVPSLVQATGLSRQGVELGFESLEREATPADLAALVASAGDARHVHVILSANVFVAPLRAIAVARAASRCVTVRPSSREPTFARALIAQLRDPAIAIADSDGAEHADRIDVYGRDETIAEIQRGANAKNGVGVRGHGAGLGVAIVTAAATLGDAAEALASDVVPFDQRGCLSPRVVLVEGPPSRAEEFAAALHDSLAAWEIEVPRGASTPHEAAEAARWRETHAFAGRMWSATHHAVAIVSGGETTMALSMPPPGRHVLVVSVDSMSRAGACMGPIARYVVTVGTNEPERFASTGDTSGVVPGHARLARLGSMQRPPLDGPVDRRGILLEGPAHVT